jgi:glucose-6-phosphate 1-epimerase
LGKSTSETDGPEGDSSIKLDFGLSAGMLEDTFKKAWPYDFGLVYSVTLTKASLVTLLQVQNNGADPFDFQVLFHSYFRVEDISMIRVLNLESQSYVDKTQNASTHTETSPAIAITQETDRVYQSLDPGLPIAVSSTIDSSPIFTITRERLNDIVLWNPWVDKAKGMGDFSPDEGYRNMICVEAGSVVGWQTLEPGDTWEGGQTIRPRL